MLRLCLVALVAFCGTVRAQIPNSPCPDIFSYREDGGIYYGEISIRNDGSKNLNLGVNISMVGQYQNAKLKFDLLTPKEDISSAPILKYRVNFPFQNVIPKITQITFNDRLLCHGPGEPLTRNGVTNLRANIIYTINTVHWPEPPAPSFTPDGPSYHGSSSPPRDHGTSQVPDRDTCGVANEILPLVLGGENTAENEFPWLVALFQKRGSRHEFQCTSNLITRKHILTAAHCVWFHKVPLFSKEEILLVLGRSNLSSWTSTSALLRTALEVTPHPDYRQGTGHCDLAIITMNKEVTSRTTVRPICLWNFDSNTLTGENGTVAGWGKSNQQEQNVAQPMKISMPIVPQGTCLRSHGEFYKLTSNMTFCAGNKDGRGPCSGDSGAGFIIKRAGKWFLRGLVSTAIKDQGSSCDLSQYVVFADVAQSMEWIKNITMKSALPAMTIDFSRQGSN